MKARSWIAALVVAGLLTPCAAMALNGHFLHGVGAVNSAMGGVGVAVPSDVLTALRHNPALLTRLEGHSLAFSVEVLEGDAVVRSTVSTPFGPVSGSTEDVTDPGQLPAFGWSRTRDDGSLAYGMGFLAVAGFTTDYPQDPTNPVLLPQPQGFGTIHSEYNLLSVPLSIAWELNPRLALGVSLVGGWATLASRPFGGVAPDCSSPVDCFFPAVDEDGAFGAGLQLGLYYQATETVSLGLSYTSRQEFEDFSWATQVANPNLPTFGAARRVRFNIDVPQTVAFGVGLTPSSRFKLGIEGRWIDYSGTDGFDTGFDPRTGAARGLGWQSIWAAAVGGEYRFDNDVALRFGYNTSESAVTSETVFINIGSPAMFEDKVTVGVGIPLYDSLSLDLGYYRSLSNQISGPFLSPVGPVPGTRVESDISADSFLMTFSFDL